MGNLGDAPPGLPPGDHPSPAPPGTTKGAPGTRTSHHRRNGPPPPGVDRSGGVPTHRCRPRAARDGADLRTPAAARPAPTGCRDRLLADLRHRPPGHRRRRPGLHLRPGPDDRGGARRQAVADLHRRRRPDATGRRRPDLRTRDLPDRRPDRGADARLDREGRPGGLAGHRRAGRGPARRPDHPTRWPAGGEPRREAAPARRHPDRRLGRVGPGRRRHQRRPGRVRARLGDPAALRPRRAPAGRSGRGRRRARRCAVPAPGQADRRGHTRRWPG